MVKLDLHVNKRKSNEQGLIRLSLAWCRRGPPVGMDHGLLSEGIGQGGLLGSQPQKRPRGGILGVVLCTLELGRVDQSPSRKKDEVGERMNELEMA